MEAESPYPCGWCGMPIPQGEDNCPSCGQIFAATRTCHRCQAQVPMTEQVCRNCGTFVGNELQDNAWDPGARRETVPVMPAGSAGVGAPLGEVPAKKPIWARPARIDPVSIAAAGIAVCTICFYWVPNLGLLLSVTGLVLVAIGIFRYFVNTEYGQLWLLIVSAIVLIAGLVFGFAWGRKIDIPITTPGSTSFLLAAPALLASLSPIRSLRSRAGISK